MMLYFWVPTSFKHELTLNYSGQQKQEVQQQLEQQHNTTPHDTQQNITTHNTT